MHKMFTKTDSFVLINIIFQLKQTYNNIIHVGRSTQEEADHPCAVYSYTNHTLLIDIPIELKPQ